MQNSIARDGSVGTDVKTTLSGNVEIHAWKIPTPLPLGELPAPASLPNINFTPHHVVDCNAGLSTIKERHGTGMPSQRDQSSPLCRGVMRLTRLLHVRDTWALLPPRTSMRAPHRPCGIGMSATALAGRSRAIPRTHDIFGTCQSVRARQVSASVGPSHTRQVAKALGEGQRLAAARDLRCRLSCHQRRSHAFSICSRVNTSVHGDCEICFDRSYRNPCPQSKVRCRSHTIASRLYVCVVKMQPWTLHLRLLPCTRSLITHLYVLESGRVYECLAVHMRSSRNVPGHCCLDSVEL